MIPIKLTLKGFLSYREPAEVDFTGFNLACISGRNGAGKSSLLDAFTWVLFGQARRRDEALINHHPGVRAAEVSLEFSYEDVVYRVQRTLPRGRTTQLEFSVRSGDEWRILTDRTMRDTQALIERTLRMDYDTFVNAAFFLQGRADQFARQPAAKRKEILGSILGLEIWDTYREWTFERRRNLERESDQVKARLGEIESELAEEADRRSALADLEKELQRLTRLRQEQEKSVEAARRTAAVVREQERMVETLAAQQERSQASLNALQARIASRRQEQRGRLEYLQDAERITAAFAAWQANSSELDRWEKTALQFHRLDEQRQPLLLEIQAEKARLEHEKEALQAEEQAFEIKRQGSRDLQPALEKEQAQAALLEAGLAEMEAAAARSLACREEIGRLSASNKQLSAEMNALVERIKKLEGTEGAACPLCGRPLSPADRQTLIGSLQQEGKQKGDLHRANQGLLAGLQAEVSSLQQLLEGRPRREAALRQAGARIAQLEEKLAALNTEAEQWKTERQPRLAGILASLAGEKYAAAARKKLQKLETSLAGLGYDPARHAELRRLVEDGRQAQSEQQAVEMARAALAPLESELAGLSGQEQDLIAELRIQEDSLAEARASLQAGQAGAPDLTAMERSLFEIQEQENSSNQEVGAARQKVNVLESLRNRKAELEDRLEEARLAVGRHKTLERAFGREGIPALLIEQALPEIEEHANELLDRMSDGSMSVRFATQVGYKDSKRSDLRETLEIQISDGSGLREYETFSGGEAFRIDFAIRLALSRVLARRKGARLQTLVIDEGFGSQDAQGRQRLIEAINTVRGEFARILVITHLEELKDAFPNRIEVEKTGLGSSIHVY